MDEILKEKICKAMNEDFVGNYVFSDKDLASIYDESSYILRKNCGEWGAFIPRADYELIFVALVNLAKKWDSQEESFFEYIYKRLLGNRSGGKAYNQITNIITALKRSEKIYMLNSYAKRYYATLCSHSFSPSSSIESFFEMCWEIYCNDLDQQYIKNNPDYLLITQSLRNKFSSYGSDEDDFSIGSKVYSFRAGVKGLAIDEPALMTKLIDNTIESIHSLFNYEPIKLDKYISILINNWWKKKESTFGHEIIRSQNKHEHIIGDYSQIKAMYILEEGIAKLYIPPIRINKNFDYQPNLEILVNGKSEVCEKMITRGSGVLMATKPLEFDLSNYSLDATINISVKIEHCGNTIYNSQESLYREFILFKDSKEILSPNCLPGIYFLYTSFLGNLLQRPNDIHRNKINTYSLESFEGEVLQSKNKTVFFISEKSNRDLYFFAKEHYDVVFRYGDDEYKVIDGELFVDINDNLDMKDYGVKYEESTFKLSEFSSEIVSNKIRFLVSGLLNVAEPQRISIFRFSDNLIFASINLIKFNNIRISYDKDIYYGKGATGKVDFLTDKFNVGTTFGLNKNEISINFEGGELLLYPPILRWKIDDNEWNTEEYCRGLWYKEFTNSSILTLDYPKTINCIVALNNNDIIEQNGKNFDYKLGQTIYALINNERYLMNNSFNVIVKSTTNQFFFLAEIFYKELFIQEPMFVFSKIKQMIWQPEYYMGDADSIFRLDILDSNRIIFTKNLSIEREIINFSTLDEGYYKYIITLLGGGFLNKETRLYIKDFVFGDEMNLKYKNKVLAIKQVVLFDKNEPEKVKTIYIDDIHYLGNRRNFDYYSGLIFVVGQEGKKIYLNNMKNDFANYIKINPIRIEIKSDNSCYLGFGLDTQDEDFEYDDEFSLDIHGRTTIGQKSLGQETRNIDYFIFEVNNNV